MAPPVKSATGGTQNNDAVVKDLQREVHPSNNLWIGNLSPKVTDFELKTLFAAHGEVIGINTFPSRRYAFVHFKKIEGANLARQGLQGYVLHGKPLVINFAKSQSLHIGSQEGDSECSKVLLIRYPPPLIIEEHMLRSALSPFGEIKRINTSTDMHFAYVQFRTEEEASCARECLQGKLFNDPRISIEYSSSELGRRARLSEYPHRPVQTDMLDLNRPVSASVGPHRPDVATRPISRPRIMFEPVVPGPGHQTPAGEPNLRRLSSAPGMISFSSPGFSLPNKCVSGGRDSFRSNELHREFKRSRLDAAWSAEMMKTEGENYLPTLSVRTGAVGQHRDHSDCMWRGTIAKGGSPVCRARCVALGEDIDTRLPTVVDCSGRIGLDLLSRQYTSGIGCNLLLFLPDSEEDFSSYTEFLRYLIAKDWAGVAKLDDGTTLFLVPPSNFLNKVLNASAPLRLHGVVLKFSEPASNIRSVSALSIQPQYGDAHNETYMQTGDNVVYPEQRPFPVTYSGVLPKVSVSPPGAPPLLSSSLHGHSVPPDDVNVSGGKAIDHGTDASKFVSSSSIQQEACHVPLSIQVSVNDASRPLPSEVECEHQNQQLQTAVNKEIHESTETEAEKNERYRAMLLFAASLLSRVRQQRGNSPGHGNGADDSAPSSGT